jgi:hypothetical protein
MIKTDKTATERIFENIIFLADVFGDKLEKECLVVGTERWARRCDGERPHKVRGRVAESSLGPGRARS